MQETIGVTKSIFYFDRPGPVNTRKTLELACERARDLKLDMVVASQWGTSLKVAVDVCRGTGVRIIGVTRPPGRVHTVTQIAEFGTYNEVPELQKMLDEWKAAGNENVRNYMLKEDEDELRAAGVTIVKGDNPIRTTYTQPLELHFKDAPRVIIKNVDDLILHSLGIYGSPLGTVVKVVMLAVEAGAIPTSKEVVGVAGTEKGLDYAIVAKPSTAAAMFDETNGFEVREIICKPRTLAGKGGYLLERRIG